MSLTTLRSNPANATLTNVYRTYPGTDIVIGTGTLVEGRKCMIGAKEVEPGIFDLVAHPDKHSAFVDYFYPWLRTAVGWVKVPKGVPDGTIVMTGGVNGCTIVVSESGANLYFYHDGDSKYLKPTMVTGNEVARVTPNDYDPNNFTLNHFSGALGTAARTGVKPVGDVSYGHFIVAVKRNNNFELYATGVMSLNGLTKINSPARPLVASFAC